MTPTQTIFLGYFPKHSKKSIVFRACLVPGSFLLRLKTITMCFEPNIFRNNLTGNVYKQFFLKNIVDSYQNRNQSQTFLWG